VIVYLHGFNSTPASRKARELEQYLADRGRGHRFRCPQLPHRPEDAIAIAEQAIVAAAEPVTLVGSSLGGYYATWLAERHDLRAVLLNPACYPHRDLRALLGRQRNLYSGEEYELTAAHLDAWARMFVAEPTPTRYLLIVETADELLDYREAVGRYRGAEQIVVEGGDHMLQSYVQHLPRIARFAGLQAAGDPSV
jgi:predicted esterase YcpF (UPF0227 family)